MTYLFPPSIPSVAVVGSAERFPVHRIYCVGRNYADHAREMGGDPEREPPFFFLKPADAVVESGAAIPYPPNTANLHHEIELVVALGQGGTDIPVDRALDHVFGYATGLDLTRRDRQSEAREQGRPWDLAKAFDRSAPVSAIRRASEVGHPVGGRIWLTVDGAVKQDSDVGKLIWSVAETIAILSGSWTLKPGDLIFTGTPEGVGPVAPGSTIVGEVEGLEEIRITVGS